MKILVFIFALSLMAIGNRAHADMFLPPIELWAGGTFEAVTPPEYDQHQKPKKVKLLPINDIATTTATTTESTKSIDDLRRELAQLVQDLQLLIQSLNFK